MTIKVVEFEVPEHLKKRGIGRIAKEIGTIVVKYLDIPIRFAIIRKDWDKAIRSFRHKAEDIIPDRDTIQALELYLSEIYLKITTEETADDFNEARNTLIQKANVSFDIWYTKLVEKQMFLYSTVQEKMPNIWPMLEFALSIRNILYIKDSTLPFAGILLGSPGTYKTVIINKLLKNWRQTYFTDSFSAKSFVSHSTAVAEERLKEIDMLPKIKDKMLLTPELAPMFTTKDDDLANVFGIITRILDGHGYESDSGAHGHRGYSQDIMFVWLGAAVEIPYKVQKLLGNLGHRLYFLRQPKDCKTEDQYVEQLIKNDFPERIGTIRTVLFDYLTWLESCPIMDHQGGLPKLKWKSEKDNQQAIRRIIRLATLLGHLRGVVLTRETQGTQGLDYAFTIAIIEQPDKALTPLYNLARGHALFQGRDHVTMDDIPMIVKVVLSSAASAERVKAFDLLIRNNGQLTTGQLAEGMNTSAHTALRTMAEFKALEIVNLIELGEGENPIKQIQLKQNFAWFLTSEFKKLQDGFEPGFYDGDGKLVNPDNLQTQFEVGPEHKENTKAKEMHNADKETFTNGTQRIDEQEKAESHKG